MKKIFILPILLCTFGANASMTFYYDSGSCDTLCDFQHVGPGCCPEGHIISGADIVAKLNADYSEQDEAVFAGVNLPDGRQFIDYQGNLKVSVSDLRSANVAGQTLISSTTCTSGREKNGQDRCVGTTEDTVYVPADTDLSGMFEVLTKSDEDCREFKIQFHGYANAAKPGSGTISGVPSNLLYCKFKDGYNGCYQDAAHKTLNQNIPVPTESTGEWEFRGYYYGTADGTEFYDWGLTGGYVCITDHGIVLPGPGQGATWCGTLAGVWSPRYVHVGWHELCSGPDDPDDYCLKLATTEQTRAGSPLDKFFPRTVGATTIPTTWNSNQWIHLVTKPGQCSNGNVPTIHLFGGWARKCNPNAPHATCSLEISRKWNSVADDFTKGDVTYANDCTDGYVYHQPQQNNYSPTCDEPSWGSINFVFKNLTGKCTVNGNWGCTAGDGVNTSLPGKSNIDCGTSGYAVASWQTNDGQTWSLGATNVPCNGGVLGVNSGDASITATLCDCGNEGGSARCTQACSQ